MPYPMPPPPPPPPYRPYVPTASARPGTARALVLGVIGVGVGLIGVVAGVFALAFSGGEISANYVLDSPFLNAFAIGIAALVLGPLGYFLGRSAKAVAANVIGIGATVIGAASTLLWLVITLLGYFGAPPAQ